MVAVHHELAVLEMWELLGRCLGKPELAARVLHRFQKQLADDITQIETALDSEEYEVARETVHRLKGAAANVAAHALREQAHALESALQLELADQYRLVLRGLKSEQARFEEVYKQISLNQVSTLSAAASAQ